MKFSIERETLVEALQLVTGAIEKRQTLPVLSNVLLEVNQDQLRLTGTDLEVELAVTLKLKPVQQAGETTLPARKFIDIVKSLPDDKEITFTLNEKNRVVIQSGRSKFTLSTLPATDFPHVEEGVGTNSFTLPCSVLADMIDRTSFAMAQQDVRYYLNGMYLEIENKQLKMVATDGHRLAMMEYAPLPEEISASVIIPRKGILELGRLVSTRSDNVTLTLGINHIKAELNNTRFTSKLVDGKFPDYQRVIPTNSDKTIIVDRVQFKQGLQRASILSNEKFKGVRLVLDNKGITLFSHNPEQEEAEVYVDAEVKGDLLEIGFNVQYLQEVTNSCRVEKIKLQLGEVNSSCLIEAEGESNALYVIMPMKL